MIPSYSFRSPRLVSLCLPFFVSHFVSHFVSQCAGKTVTTLPFDPSVPDFAHGSETQYTGDEEYMQGCMWTFRQLAEVCHQHSSNTPGPECAEASIMAHQCKGLYFYTNRRSNHIDTKTSCRGRLSAE